MKAGRGLTLLTLALAQGLTIDSEAGEELLTAKRIDKGRFRWDIYACFCWGQ